VLHLVIVRKTKIFDFGPGATKAKRRRRWWRKQRASEKLCIVVPQDKRVLLASACGNEEKCICINNAIFKNDSAWATAGVGERINNPCNMRPPQLWTPSVLFSIYNAKGNGQFAKFKTLNDGVTACAEL
jgi:hypothetical protein